jgi:hypothetical protein
MSLEAATDRQDPVEPPDGCSARSVAMLAYLLAAAAIVDVALAFWHRETIVAMWDHLHRRSYRPYEAYETYGIDMDTVYGSLFLSCIWLVLQLVSLLSYLCVRRRIGLVANLGFAALWLLSLIGAVAYQIVIRTVGWGADGP